MSTKSRFVWHDLMAADVEGAKSFYGELFGWKFKRGESGYEHVMLGEEAIGGVMKLDPHHGAPPHWLGYVSVDDVAAAVGATTQNGGKVYVPKTEIQNVGQFAIVADPTGATFSPFLYTGKDGLAPEPGDRPAPYTFCWDELLTSDPEAAVRFYSTVFGWGVERMEMPELTYTLLKRTGVKDAKGSDKNAGGVMKRPPGVPVSFWLTYVAVPNADTTVEKAKRLGATITTPPTDIPNVGRFATLLDREHAAFAILAPPA
jgi:predicted enzyme related to lactoylglutathione lyase